MRLASTAAATIRRAVLGLARAREVQVHEVGRSPCRQHGDGLGGRAGFQRQELDAQGAVLGRGPQDVLGLAAAGARPGGLGVQPQLLRGGRGQEILGRHHLGHGEGRALAPAEQTQGQVRVLVHGGQREIPLNRDGPDADGAD
jgi:hypothetical protein